MLLSFRHLTSQIRRILTELEFSLRVFGVSTGVKMNLVARGGARLRWQSQPRRNSEGSDYAEVEQETSWQASAGMD